MREHCASRPQEDGDQVFGRTPKLPRELAPTLEREERVITWARTDEGAVVVTNRGLWLPGERGRLPWHEIHKATWAESILTLTGSAADDASDYAFAHDVEPIRVRLSEPGAVPRRVRERVLASVAYSTLYPVPGGGSARVVARRVSGRDGLNWSVRLEGAAASRTEDPAVKAAVDQFVAASKASIDAAP